MASSDQTPAILVVVVAVFIDEVAIDQYRVLQPYCFDRLCEGGNVRCIVGAASFG
jgi:hypothetical protein